MLRAVDETEKFYKAKGFIDRPPSVMVDEFDNMQEEAFRVQRDLYMKIKDFEMLDLDMSQIRRILDEANMSYVDIGSLTRGIFTPIKYSEPRFERKLKDIEDLAEHKTEKSKNFIYNVERDYVYPRRELDEVMRNWDRKELFPDGYKPEEQGAVTNDKGNVVYDENGKIKREPTILERGWEKIKPMILPGTPSDLRSQTPLPPTPAVDAKQVANVNQNITQTGLTHTENALLSNSEKAMRLKQRGQA